MHTSNKDFKVRWNPYFWPSVLSWTLCPGLNDGFAFLDSSDSPCIVTKFTRWGWWRGGRRAGGAGERGGFLPTCLNTPICICHCDNNFPYRKYSERCRRSHPVFLKGDPVMFLIATYYLNSSKFSSFQPLLSPLQSSACGPSLLCMSKWGQCLQWIPYPSFFRTFLGLINMFHQFTSDVTCSFMLRLPALSLLLLIAIASCSWDPSKATSYLCGHQLSLHSPKAQTTLDCHFSQFFFSFLFFWWLKAWVTKLRFWIR